MAMDPSPPRRLRAKLQESSVVDDGMCRARRVFFREANTMQETVISTPGGMKKIII